MVGKGLVGLGALSLLAAGLHFAWRSAAPREPLTQLPSDASAPQSSADRPLAEPLQRYLPPVIEELNGRRAAPPTPAPPALIFVLSKRERSDVRIDGQWVGQTPYMGQLPCDEGEVVKITLRYPDGTTRSFERPCKLEIRVDDR